MIRLQHYEVSKMNVFIVRTRLQSLIIEKIISVENVKPYILVICYFENKNEDAPEVYISYEHIKKNAVFSLDMFANDSFVRNVAKYMVIHLIAYLTKDRIFLAGVDNFAFAFAAKLFPFSEINTFDDGSYNVLKSSKYFSESALDRNGIKGIISKTLFPKGGAKYLRDRTNRHYTVFPDLENIVEKSKLIDLEWDWARLLDKRDLDKLPSKAGTILLGTAFQDFSVTKQKKLKETASKLIANSDLYIMHPREKPWLDSSKVIRLHSPAEAVLKYLQGIASAKLTVYHYDTTTSYSLKNDKNIKFIDLLDDG